jgi:hypothetical protein
MSCWGYWKQKCLDIPIFSWKIDENSGILGICRFKRLLELFCGVNPLGMFWWLNRHIGKFILF